MTIFMRFMLAIVAVVVAFGGVLRADEKTPEEPTSPRELFRLLGVGDDYFNRFSSSRVPIEGAEKESLLRILFRLRMFPVSKVDDWAIGPEKLAEAIARPDQFRGSIFRLRGRVIEVEPLTPAAEAAGRDELTKYYRCRLQLDSAGETAEVYAENVPAAWRKGAKPEALGGAFGVFLKVAGRSPEQTTLVFAARRVAWYRDDPLGRLGMDVGLLDEVQDQQPLTAKDSEAFYQMFAAVGRAEPGQLLRQAEADLPNVPRELRRTDQEGQEQYAVKPLFNDPDAQRGRLVELMGTARLIEEIHIDNRDIVDRFGFDHYYQVSLFTDDSYDKQLEPAAADVLHPRVAPGNALRQRAQLRRDGAHRGLFLQDLGLSRAQGVRLGAEVEVLDAFPIFAAVDRPRVALASRPETGQHQADHDRDRGVVRVVHAVDLGAGVAKPPARQAVGEESHRPTDAVGFHCRPRTDRSFRRRPSGFQPAGGNGGGIRGRRSGIRGRGSGAGARAAFPRIAAT